MNLFDSKFKKNKQNEILNCELQIIAFLRIKFKICIFHSKKIKTNNF